jgi:hypothetical protein
MYATTQMELRDPEVVRYKDNKAPKLQVIDSSKEQENQRIKLVIQTLKYSQVPKHFHNDTYLSLETEQGAKDFANLETRDLFRLLNDNSQVARVYAGCVDELANHVLDNLENQGNARIAYDAANKLSAILDPNAIYSKEKTMCLEESLDTIKIALRQPTDAMQAIQDVRTFAKVAKQYASAYKMAQLRY